MGAYKHNVVVAIKMSAYIHGVPILCGCLLSRFYSSSVPMTVPNMHMYLVNVYLMRPKEFRVVVLNAFE